ncbi:hypothetical protein GQ53DRAFT_820881 [Thozetella sp. PMI_491]|nr:hypothetical protein GQ53DRAFT_820881 [Thozetella sp. PMI_491]
MRITRALSGWTGMSLFLAALAQDTITPVPVIPPSSFESVAPIFTHTGPFDARTRANPALNFFEKYVTTIENLDLENEYPDFYALNCTFYDTTGATYVGGPAIDAWIKQLFSPLEKIVANHHVHRVIPFTSTPGIGAEGANEAQDAVDLACGKDCTWIFTEHDLIFYLAAPLEGPGIPVRRSMDFLLGPAQVPGQGTDGKQWYEVKVWWDVSILSNEIARRQSKRQV